MEEKLKKIKIMTIFEAISWLLVIPTVLLVFLLGKTTEYGLWGGAFGVVGAIVAAIIISTEKLRIEYGILDELEKKNGDMQSKSRRKDV